MTFHRILIVGANFAGVAFGLLFMPPSLGFWGIVLTCPVFMFGIWGCCNGRMSYTDEDDNLISLDSDARPKEFYFAMWMHLLLAWCLMLAVISGRGA
jgi:hypothetical protein